MKLEAPKNPNYAATVVALKDFVVLPNCDNIKAALIFGNSVIVAKEAEAGAVGLFFPPECALSAEFLAANNLYRHAEWGNVDAKAKGFFEQHGRVKTVKFRGNKSEGFWIPISCLNGLLNEDVYVNPGDTFDTLGGVEICRKYVPKGNPRGEAQARGKQPQLEDSIVVGQFRFHFDTENLRRNIHKILPTDYISITDKWHGTSVVIGKLLVKRDLTWIERLLVKFGVRLDTAAYGLTYSSRRVIKAVNGRAKTANHYYSEDVWGAAAKSVEDKIPNGFTLYGEIVGYTADGKPIQGGYTYGCEPGKHRLLVYRATLTTLDGIVIELPWLQLKEFCEKYGLETVREINYGSACDLFPVADLDYETATWGDAFLKKLETAYVNDGDCPHNVKGTPAEGIVVRIDRLNECESFKLKNFRFLERESKELDKGEMDLETAQCEEEQVLA